MYGAPVADSHTTCDFDRRVRRSDRHVGTAAIAAAHVDDAVVEDRHRNRKSIRAAVYQSSVPVRGS